jgi:hypothetical protein
MQIAAFNKVGDCGVMADTIQEVIGLLIDQTADIEDYTYYYVDNDNPLKLALTHDTDKNK